MLRSPGNGTAWLEDTRSCQGLRRCRSFSRRAPGPVGGSGVSAQEPRLWASGKPHVQAGRSRPPCGQSKMDEEGLAQPTSPRSLHSQSVTQGKSLGDRHFHPHYTNCYEK